MTLLQMVERRYQLELLLDEIEPIFFSKHNVEPRKRSSWLKETEDEYVKDIVPLIKETNELQIEILKQLGDKVLFLNLTICLIAEKKKLIVKELI